MSYVKNYDVGQIKLDLPYANYIHELPLLSFGDVKHTINLSLVYNSERKAAGDNSFHIASGYQLNLQKKLVVSDDTISYREANGKIVTLNRFGDTYTFSDDSQRILRRIEDFIPDNPTDEFTPIFPTPIYRYLVEYPDFSKEEYDTNGYITSVCDKYGETFLNYVYGENNRLTSIVYRGTKIITLNYESNKLASIAYGGKTIGFGYNTNKISVCHDSGVKYMLELDGENFTVSAYPDENTDIAVHEKKCVFGTNTITMLELIEENNVNSTVYTFVASNEISKSALVDITDKHGVTTRMQFENDKLAYSYEVTEEVNNQVTNNSIKYTGTVAVYNNNDVVGYQSYNDGERMIDMNGHGGVHSIGVSGNATRTFVLSGWINAHGADECTITIRDDTHPAHEFSVEYKIPIIKTETWQYFACGFKASNPQTLMVSSSPYCPQSCLRDLRLTVQEGIISEPTRINRLKLTREVLIQESSTGNDAKYFVLNDNDNSFHFYNGTTLIEHRITAKDILKYKINQMYGTYENEIYFDNCRGVITNANALMLQYVENGNTFTIPVTELAVGTKAMNYGKTYVTKTNFYTKNGEIKLIRKSTVDTVLYKEDILNDKMDLVSSETNGVTTLYERNEKGLVTSETLTYNNIDYPIIRRMTYDDDCTKLLSTRDEFGTITTYETDDTWGIVKKATVNSESSVSDEYDDDMCALTSRTFAYNTDDTDARKTSFEYLGGNVVGYTHGNNGKSINYGFEYENGVLKKIAKNGAAIEENALTNEDKTLTTSYPNSTSPVYTVIQTNDKYGRLSKVDGLIENSYDIAPVFLSATGEYDSAEIDNGSGKLAKTKDLTTNIETKYAYDKERISRIGTFSASGTKTREESFVYDSIGRMTEDRFDYDSANGKYIKHTLEYTKVDTDPLADGLVHKHSYNINGNGNVETNNYYDRLNRNYKKYCTLGGKTFEKTLGFTKTRPNTMVEQTDTGILATTSYTYDALGRIASMISDGRIYTYEYDEYGQLVQEEDVTIDKNTQYVYNGIGNIESITTTTSSGSTSTQTFTYGDNANPDRLTKFGTKEITYNTMGCPLSYDGKNFTWSKGKLNSVTKGSLKVFTSPYETYSYTYNALGQRTAKRYTYRPANNFATSGSYLSNTNTAYTYDNSGRLIREARTYSYSDSTSYSLEFIFLYDESGMIGVQFKNGDAAPQLFYYQRNLQGDVIAIYNTSGVLQAKYHYDTWGNCTVTNSTNIQLATYNPIRYRGYYYDDETKWYFLNARYYSPEWRRFISPDDTAYLDPESVNGLNLYCYCGNDPVNYADPSGHFAFWLATGLVIGAIGLIAGGTYAGIKSSKAGDTGWDLVSDIAFGAVIGGIAGFAAGALLGAGASALLTGSFLSSVQAVKAGAVLTCQMFRAAGMAAAGYMMLDNLSNAINNHLHVFWSGGDIAKNQAVSYANQNGGITLEMTKLGKYLETLPYDADLWSYASQNFANQVSNNGIVRAILYYPEMRRDAIWFTERKILIKKMVEIIIGSLQ